MSEKYKHLEVEDSKGAPAPEEVAAIEAKLGRPLPQDFLDFLSVANGAYLDYCVRVPPNGEILSFCGIYLAGKNERGGYGYETFIHEIETERAYQNIPKGVLPFARDGGSSVVYLDLTPEGGGRVVAFVHGLPDWAGGREGDRFIEIAPSFADYIEMLFKCEDET